MGTPMPDTLGNLANLQGLGLYNNRIGGTVPESVGNLMKLTFLDLHFNGLIGSIPESFGRMSSSGSARDCRRKLKRKGILFL